MKWFNGDKGYDFIAAEDAPDVFVPSSAITSAGYRSLEEGQKVEFDITRARRGPTQKTAGSPANTLAGTTSALPQITLAESERLHIAKGR